LKDVTIEFPVYGAWNRSILGGWRHGSEVRTPALRDVTVSFAAGDRVAVLGPNGAGKTTLLRACAGLLSPLRGTVEVMGRPSVTLSLGCDCYPGASVLETAVLMALLDGRPLAEARLLADEILAFAGVTRIASQRADTLLSGPLFRLGISAALFLGNDIIILDEVMETADPEFVATVKRRLATEQVETRILLVIERARAIINGLCTKALVVENGQVIAFGAFDDIMARHGARLTF